MKKHKIIFLMIVTYIIGISGYGYYSYLSAKDDIVVGVDKELKASAFAIRFILGDEYLNKATSKDAITQEYYFNNARRLTSYAKLADIEYLYSFVKVGDKIYFTSSSFTQADLRDNKMTKYFDLYDEASDILKTSFEQKEIMFEESTDKWGTFRSVFVPIEINGTTFIAGADIKVRHIDSLLARALLDSLITGVFFLLLIIPVVLLYIQNIEREKKQLELIINDKTSELKAINKELQNLSTQLAKYLSPQLYNSIFTSKQEVKIGSKRKKLTIFFSDIKNFIKMTDHLEPEDLTYILNSYLNEMSIIALKYGATIDKFIGDAILIFFGDPESKGVKEDALLCVSMAIEMKAKMEELRQKWLKNGITQPFQIRMGINTGYCTVGNFGSENKLDYTIIGNHVNLANRLESCAGANEILISQDTYLLIKESVACIKKDAISVKGFEQDIQTYQVSDTFHRNVLEERLQGFSLSVDFDNQEIDKSKVIQILESTLLQLKD
jgi:class 3 adenylate cyclase